MSRRKVGDWLREAFFAKDKASLDKIVRDYEATAKTKDQPPDDDHEEPDGDEGNENEVHSGHKGGIHIHVAGGGGDAKTKDEANEERLKGCEDKIASIDSKLSQIMDHIASKDEGGLPPWLKKKDDGEEETADEDVGSKVTEEGSSTPAAITMNDPPSAEAELMEADPVPEGERTRMGDAAYASRRQQGIQRLVRDTIARAEVLAPGIKVGTFDAQPDSKTLGGQLCQLRRTALTKAAATDEGKAVIGNYVASLKTMSCDAVRYVFRDASERMRAQNNARSVPSPMFGDQVDQLRTFRGRNTEIVKGINAANREYWAKQGVGNA